MFEADLHPSSATLNFKTPNQMSSPKKKLTKMADFHLKDFEICRRIIKKFEKKIPEEAPHPYIPLRRKSEQAKPPKQIKFSYSTRGSRPASRASSTVAKKSVNVALLYRIYNKVAPLNARVHDLICKCLKLIDTHNLTFKEAINLYQFRFMQLMRASQFL
jgi:hypothetical protein